MWTNSNIQKELNSKISKRFHTLITIKSMLYIVPLLQVGLVLLYFTMYFTHTFLSAFLIIASSLFLRFFLYISKVAIESLEFKKPEHFYKTQIRGQNVIAVCYNIYTDDGSLKWHITEEDIKKTPDNTILRTILWGKYVELNFKEHKKTILEKLQ